MKMSIIKKLGKRLKIYYAYACDAYDFTRLYLNESEKKNKPEYRIMLLVHSLEKGMCMPKPRPYGAEKAEKLVKILTKMESKQSFEYSLGCSALTAWISFYSENGFQLADDMGKVKEFVLTNQEYCNLFAGKKVINQNEIKNTNVENTLLSRRSIRDYELSAIAKKDIDFALKCFIKAPSACNRQMCRVYQVSSNKLKELFNENILGISGFNKDAVNYFVITYDIAAFDYAGERNQGFFNAGLAAMSFVNGLHLRGIGSCFMEWSNSRKQDCMIRKQIGLNESERIAVIIGAGYYKSQSVIAASCRRPISDIFQKL